MKYALWLIAGTIFFALTFKDATMMDVILASFVNVTVCTFFPDVMDELKRIGRNDK
jgi:hypothetical protein